MRGYRSMNLHCAGLLRAWSHEDETRTEHFIVPHHEVSLVAQLGGRDAGAVIYGTHSTADRYRPAAGVRSVAVALAPEVAVRVTGISVPELADCGAPMPSRLRTALEPLLEPMVSMATIDALAVWTRAIAALTEAERGQLGGTAAATRRIRETAGRMPVAAIAGELGLCERALRRRMRADLGLTPKAYGRLVRLLACVEASDRSVRPAWADLAARFGYADQAHLVRDCAAMTGLTPARLHGVRSAASEIFNTA